MINKDHKKGFTFLELIIAIIILMIAMTICFQAFSGILRSWKRSMVVTESMQHGDFLINQISTAINCMIFFDDDQKSYAFKHTDGGYLGDNNTDFISFVTSSSLLSHKNYLFNIPHRVQLFIDEYQGNISLCSISMPVTQNEEDFIDQYQPELHVISNNIQGMDILFWDNQNEEWVEIWEKENSIPKKILISIYVAIAKNEESILYERILHIPAAESLNNPISSPTISQITQGD